MGYKQPSSGLPFKELGSSPAKQIHPKGLSTSEIEAYREKDEKPKGKKKLALKQSKKKVAKPVDLAKAPTLGPKELPVNEGGPKSSASQRLSTVMQKLSPRASAAKAKRDLLAAKTPNRRAKKAENQRLRRAAKKAGVKLKGKDYDHKDKKFKTVKANRGNDGEGTKNE